MSNKTYLLKGKSVPHKIKRCPNCKTDWFVKMYYDDNDLSDIKFETESFNMKTKNNVDDKSTNKIYTCKICSFEYEEKLKYHTEEDFNKAIKNSDKELMKDKVIEIPPQLTKTISGVDLDGKKMEEIMKEIEKSI